MFEDNSGGGGGHPQSAGNPRQPLPDPSQDRSNNATGSAAVSGQSSGTGWLPSGRSRPCPICGRTKDGDCRISGDGLKVICHHPKDLKPGDVVDGWAFTGNTIDDRAGHFTIDKPRAGAPSRPGKVVPIRQPAPAAASAPDPATITLARLPEPGKEPPAHWPNGQKLAYGSDGRQWVKVVVKEGKKSPYPHHLDASGKAISKAGPDPWPLWGESMALEHGPGKWIVETEGEKCAAWFHAAGLVAVSQPGHAHTLDAIQARYSRLVAAGVAGVVYLADHDKTGAEKAQRCKFAAVRARTGDQFARLPFITVPAAEVWPGLPAGGSIDDAPGTAAERVAAFEAHLQQRKTEQQAPAPAQSQSNRYSTDQWRRVLTELLGQPESLFNNQWQDCPLCGSANDFKGQEMDPGYHMICNNCGGMDGKGGMLTEICFAERILQLDRNAAKDRVARFLGVQPPQAAPAASTAGSPPPAAAPRPEAPYRVLGWSTKLDSIWVQTGQAGIVAAVPLTQNGLQRIARIGYWEALFPGRTGTDWASAISNVRDAAEALGAFTPDGIRGRGVWLDRDRVIWHLGNRIEVDGQLLPLTELQESAYTYASLPALDINPEVPQLTDAEGTAILELFNTSMKFGSDGDGLLVAGHTVLGNVGGALEVRPGLQLTGPTQASKSTTQDTMITPLQGGLGLYTSGSTGKGVAQAMKGDALPAVLDESEQENARQREDHLHLLRLSFDGKVQLKGTPGGQPNSYTMRSMITLIGINASVPNAADRNRLVIIRPRKLEGDDWTQFQLKRNKLITIETGRRLIRRTVSNLPALLANIKTFTAVMSSQRGSDRTHQVLGSLLAGAHHLTSTAVIDADAALAWLDAVGWSGLDEDALEATSADAEAHACLDHLLAYTVHWKHSDTGSITVLELLQIAKASPGATEAISALGRLGIKWNRERGLVVANSCKVFAGSKWANGNHRDHLLSLDKAQAVPSAVWFPGMGSKKAVSLPLPAETP